MVVTQVIITPNLRLVKFEACRFALQLVESANHQYKPMGNLLCSRIFIKSAVDPRNVKFGVMITWINIIVQKIFGCHSNKR